VQALAIMGGDHNPSKAAMWVQRFKVVRGNFTAYETDQNREHGALVPRTFYTTMYVKTFQLLSPLMLIDFLEEVPCVFDYSLVV
jgi:hypothetical protein